MVVTGSICWDKLSTSQEAEEEEELGSHSPFQGTLTQRHPIRCISYSFCHTLKSNRGRDWDKETGEWLDLLLQLPLLRVWCQREDCERRIHLPGIKCHWRQGGEGRKAVGRSGYHFCSKRQRACMFSLVKTV